MFSVRVCVCVCVCGWVGGGGYFNYGPTAVCCPLVPLSTILRTLEVVGGCGVICWGAGVSLC